jgi:hypothetical protein
MSRSVINYPHIHIVWSGELHCYLRGWSVRKEERRPSTQHILQELNFVYDTISCHRPSLIKCSCFSSVFSPAPVRIASSSSFNQRGTACARRSSHAERSPSIDLLFVTDQEKTTERKKGNIHDLTWPTNGLTLSYCSVYHLLLNGRRWRTCDSYSPIFSQTFNATMDKVIWWKQLVTRLAR